MSSFALFFILSALQTDSTSVPMNQRIDDDEIILSQAADRYCIRPDGDHRLTWHLAEEDGFSWLTPASFPRLRIHTSADANLRGLEKTINGVNIRVLTSAFSQTHPGDGHTYFRQCWVSASNYNQQDAERELNDLLGIRRFRSRNVLIYAWIPQADGSQRAINRRIYMRRNLTLAREQGLRQVTLKQYGAATFIAYRSPRTRETYRLFDWAGPEPVAAP